GRRSVGVVGSLSSGGARICCAYSGSTVAAAASMRSYSRRPRSVSHVSPEFLSAGPVITRSRGTVLLEAAGAFVLALGCAAVLVLLPPAVRGAAAVRAAPCRAGRPG